LTTRQVRSGTTATGHEKKSAATGDNEQALAEAQSAATGQRRKDDKPLLDPLEVDDESWGTDEVAGWFLGAFPSIFQNEAGDPYNFFKSAYLPYEPR